MIVWTNRLISMSLAVTLFVAVSAPAGAATVEEWQDSAPISAEYLDMTTLQIFAYDADLGTLTPTGHSGSVTVFACIDIYKRNQAPSKCLDPTLPDTSCGTDICWQYSVLITGSHTVKTRTTWQGLPINPNANCDGEWIQSGGSGNAVVTRVTGGGTALTGCQTGTGQATARLLIDNHQVDSDSTTF